MDSGIEELSGEIATLAQKCRSDIESLGSFVTAGGDSLAIRNAQKAAASRLQSLTIKCRTSQQLYHKKREHYDSHAQFLEVEEAKEELQEFDETQMWKDRSKDVDQLLSNFAALSEIFKELNYLVVEQGNILDRIDYNIEVAKDETAKAVCELRKVREDN